MIDCKNIIPYFSNNEKKTILGHKKYYMEIILMYLLGIILSILYLIKRDYGQFPKKLFILIMVFIIIIIFFLLYTK